MSLPSPSVLPVVGPGRPQRPPWLAAAIVCRSRHRRVTPLGLPLAPAAPLEPPPLALPLWPPLAARSHSLLSAPSRLDLRAAAGGGPRAPPRGGRAAPQAGARRQGPPLFAPPCPDPQAAAMESSRHGRGWREGERAVREGREEGRERERVQRVRVWLSFGAHVDFYWAGLLTEADSYK